VDLARGTEYGLSLGILSRDVMKALDLAARIPSCLLMSRTVNYCDASKGLVLHWPGFGGKIRR
jgi:acyl-CoA reductase-like NAD-dependent aldehyde dehydrogenase